MSHVTCILSAIEEGDAHAAEQLLPLVYNELRKLAATKMAQKALGQRLQATALVHEAYLRLVDVVEARHWDSQRHFFAAAVEAMRRDRRLPRPRRSSGKGSRGCESVQSVRGPTFRSPISSVRKPRSGSKVPIKSEKESERPSSGTGAETGTQLFPVPPAYAGIKISPECPGTEFGQEVPVAVLDQRQAFGPSGAACCSSAAGSAGCSLAAAPLGSGASVGARCVVVGAFSAVGSST
jgi:hypothetical protein